MTDLEILQEAYQRIGICFVVRHDTGYDGKPLQYLFLCSEGSRRECEIEDLDRLCRRRGFMEFQNGKIASY